MTQYNEDVNPHRRAWREKFEQFHADNPQIYDKLVEMARLVKSRGLKCSIYLLIERVRWFFLYETQGEQAKDFKINNNFSPFYARRIMAENRDLAGMFEIRDHAPHVA